MKLLGGGCLGLVGGAERNDRSNDSVSVMNFRSDSDARLTFALEHVGAEVGQLVPPISGRIIDDGGWRTDDAV